MNAEPNPRPVRLLAIDQRPGPLPRISADGTNIAYALLLAGTRGRTELVLRCDAEGDIWVSIRCSA